MMQETNNLKIQENNSTKTKNNISEEVKSTKSSIFQKKQSRASYIKIVLNTIMSLILFFVCIFAPFTYDQKWKIFYFMTLWSFYFNSFYIISITVIDWLYLIKNYYCVKYNCFIRDHYIRICFPFALAIVVLYWILILLGPQYESSSWNDIYDPCFGFIFHGLIFFFLLFDICTAFHVNKKTYIRDLLIISLLTAIYFFLLGLGKYLNFYEPYDFMSISSVRQIVGSAILIYVAILDAYVVLCLIANRLFEQENQIDYKKRNYFYQNKLENSDNSFRSKFLLENNNSRTSNTSLKCDIEKSDPNFPINNNKKFISKSCKNIPIANKNQI